SSGRRGVGACRDRPASGLLSPRFDLVAELRFTLAKLGRELPAEVLRLEDRPDLDLDTAAERRLLHPLHRLVARCRLEDPAARDYLLRLGERAVDDRRLAAGELHLLRLRRGVQPLAGQHHARLDERFVVRGHLRDELSTRHLARLGFPAPRNDYEKSHRLISFGAFSPTPGSRVSGNRIDSLAYPPASAPTIMKGSAPLPTSAGSAASGGSCDTSSAQAKKRRNARRLSVP